ncbi:MAG: acyltransferase [Syntrophomonadaceae bacterium]|nr:acyltransferase [Syntrophomonadaceae bacterium]
MQKRLLEVDLIRGGTALAVIAIHVTAGYMDLGFGYLWNHLVRFAVPLFVLMSGLVLYWQDIDHKTLPASAFYAKRLQKVLIPYIIWTIIYTMVSQHILHLPLSTLSPVTLGRNLLWGTAYYHLYFIIIILQMYLLYPLLTHWMRNQAPWLMPVSLLLSGGIQVLLYLNLIGSIFLPSQYSMLYLRAFPVWLFYFVFGMYAAEQLRKTGPFPSIFPRISYLALCWLLALGLMLLDSRLTGIYVSIVRPSVIFYTLVSYHFFLTMARKMVDWKSTWTRWLSAQSFLIYLMHPLILTILTSSARKLGCADMWSGSAGLIGLYLAVTAVTLLAAFIISRTPFAAILGGMRAERVP